jgi:hypothetical protein
METCKDCELLVRLLKIISPELEHSSWGENTDVTKVRIRKYTISCKDNGARGPIPWKEISWPGPGRVQDIKRAGDQTRGHTEGQLVPYLSSLDILKGQV